MSLFQSFQVYTRQNNLLSSPHYLLACSGGIDSVVLAHLMAEFCRENGFKTALAHVNFSLRPEADDDELFVKLLANELKMPFFSTNFNTQAFAETNKLSIQMAARQLRYQWFAEIMEHEGYKTLLTAHHANDQAETILLNQLRGTGPKGLNGILPKQMLQNTNGFLERPLLFAKRIKIESYAHENGLTWREDSSNQSSKYKRNFLRHKVLPVLETKFPAVVDTLTNNAAIFQSGWPVLEKALAEMKQKVVVEKSAGLEINLSAIRQSEAPLFFLGSILESYGFVFEIAQNIINNSELSRKFLNLHYTLYQNQHILLIKDNKANPIATNWPVFIESGLRELNLTNGNLQISVTENMASIPPEILKNAGHAFLDFKKLQFPLLVRPWQAGDKFVPFGMRGQKKISDLLTDLKIPLYQKDKTLVMLSGNDIVWVIGLRTDNRYRIDSQSGPILHLEWQEK